MNIWSELREKMAGRRVITVLGSVEIASAAVGLAEWLKALRAGKGHPEWRKKKDVKAWLRLYHHRGQVQNVLVSGMFPDWSLPAEPAVLIRCFRAVIREFRAMSPEARQAWITENKVGLDGEWTEFRPKLQKGLNTWAAGLVDSMNGRNFEDAAADRTRATIEAEFFLRVWMPCLLLYRKNPTQLVRAARLGSVSALENLLMLDKLILQEPGIAAQIQRWSDEGQRGKLARVAKGIEERPAAMKPKRVKYALAGLISAAFGSIGDRPEAPQIQAAFDIVARRACDGAAVDKDIPAGETFSKAIQRDRQGWDKIIKPDTSNP
jgi:hypothetical protein